MAIVHKLSRKIYSRFVFVLLFLCLIAAVCAGCDAYAGIRPAEIGGTWISEDPYILLQFGSGNEGSSHWYIEMDLNGEIQEVEVQFNQGSGIKIILRRHTYEAPEDILLAGRCVFSHNKFEITRITKDEIYGGKYKSIKFYRQTDS